ncbi:MAG: GNAT family N-acetyltransferase [Microthrixaceae bacterium]
MAPEDPSTSDQVRVHDASDAQRYEAHLGGALAGFAEYRRRDGRTVFTHTEVDDARTRGARRRARPW